MLEGILLSERVTVSNGLVWQASRVRYQRSSSNSKNLQMRCVVHFDVNGEEVST